jgi:NAD(P)H dehydrogenase (quinone)
MRVLVVHCHPDPASFVAAARDRAIAGLRQAGRHAVRVTDLYAEGFDPCFDEHEWRAHLEPGSAPAVARHTDDLQWCETLVLVYPTWWSGQPAMLKGWIDRVWVRGVAWDLPARGERVRPLLRNVRRIVVITTHGSSKLVNAVQGEAGKRTVTRGLRVLCNPLCRTSWIAMYGVDRSDDTSRRRFLDRVERRLATF